MVSRLGMRNGAAAYGCRVSLRLLLSLMFAACIIFAILARVAWEFAEEEARQQAIVEIDSLGAELKYRIKQRKNSLGLTFADSQCVSQVKWDGGYNAGHLSKAELEEVLVVIAEIEGEEVVRAAPVNFFRNLSRLRELEVLVVSGTRVTDSDINNLKHLTNLRELHLANTLVSKSGLDAISELSQLEVLNLEANQITDNDLTKVARLPKLEWLWLRGTEVTDSGVRKLQRSLPNCRVFH